MDTKKIIWRSPKKEYSSGKVAYCGRIGIGSYYWNGTDSSKNKYWAVFTLHSAPKQPFNTEKECEEWVENQFKLFIKEISA